MVFSPEQHRLPFEARINHFKVIAIPKRTLAEKYNYWEIKDDQVLVGYHSSKETFGETNIGTLLPVAGTDHYIFQINISADKAVLKKVFPNVLEDMKKKGIKILDVVGFAEPEAKAA